MGKIKDTPFFDYYLGEPIKESIERVPPEPKSKLESLIALADVSIPKRAVKALAKRTQSDLPLTEKETYFLGESPFFRKHLDWAVRFRLNEMLGPLAPHRKLQPLYNALRPFFVALYKEEVKRIAETDVPGIGLIKKLEGFEKGLADAKI